MSESQSHWQELSIIVYRGDPLDFQRMRHTAFYIRYSDGSMLLSQITGASGFFAYEECWDTDDPASNIHFERQISVITSRSNTVRDPEIRNTIKNTRIINNEQGWNCQNWIGDVLTRLQRAALVSAAEVVEAADKMVDVIIEAPDGE